LAARGTNVVVPRTATIFQRFSDADWAGDRETLRSTTGFILIIGGAAVGWAADIHKPAAMSKLEAEYRALREAINKAVWLNKLIRDVNLLLTQSDHLLGHIIMPYKFVWDAITTDEVIFEHCSTDQMATDPITTEPTRIKYDKHVKTMGLF